MPALLKHLEILAVAAVVWEKRVVTVTAADSLPSAPVLIAQQNEIKEQRVVFLIANNIYSEEDLSFVGGIVKRALAGEIVVVLQQLPNDPGLIRARFGGEYDTNNIFGIYDVWHYGFEENIVKSNALRWTVGAQVAPIYSYRDISTTYSSGSIANELSYNNTEDPMTSIAAGVDVNYSVSKRVSFQTGM